MTARPGDALSHVNFQAPQNTVLTEISAPEFCPWHRAAIPRFACGASVPVVFAWRP
jgi:hypothetical protein